jgi:hypothetical protein
VQGSGVGVCCVSVLRRVQRVSSRWRGVSESASQGGLKWTLVLLFAGGEWRSRIDSSRAWERRCGGNGNYLRMGLSHEGNREGTVVI